MTDNYSITLTSPLTLRVYNRRTTAIPTRYSHMTSGEYQFGMEDLAQDWSKMLLDRKKSELHGRYGVIGDIAGITSELDHYFKTPAIVLSAIVLRLVDLNIHIRLLVVLVK